MAEDKPVLGLAQSHLEQEVKRSSAKKAIEERRVENRNRQELASKKRLMGSIERKFKTTMIGALSSFEKEFGDLWGHGLDNDQLTDEQRANRSRWGMVRTEILNKSNNQSRAGQEEIAQYTMTWDKYRVDFIVNGDNKENNNE